jgi:hypothetical protein
MGVRSFFLLVGPGAWGWYKRTGTKMMFSIFQVYYIDSNASIIFFFYINFIIKFDIVVLLTIETKTMVLMYRLVF